MPFLVGIYAYASGMLSGHPHSEHGYQSGHSPPPFMDWETATLDAYHDALSKVPPCTPTLSQPGYNLLKHIKNITDRPNAQ